MKRLNCIIMGAAGRDFHDFQTFFRDRPGFVVCCFTATQIPFIDARAFPRELAGPHYEADIPIVPEQELEARIAQHDVDFVFLSYSDLAHETVMHLASRVQAAGASFALLGPKHTQLASRRPVIAVTAVRTGAGKSPLSQALARWLTAEGHRVGVVRHPMPYGDLRAQRVQRFAEPDDLDRHRCTVEEREEYQPYVAMGLPIFAGVDYRAILERAEQQSDVLLWDGGNNDRPFFDAGLTIVVVDALRPGHEERYYPGETNLRRADVVVISKVDAAPPGAVDAIRANVARLAPEAEVVEAGLELSVDEPERLGGRRVIVIEDGPTITHGGMPSGAGLSVARSYGAEVVDPRPFAVGTIAEAYAAYPHIGPVLPALGYAPSQREELARIIAAAAPDLVVDGSPARLERWLSLNVPIVSVSYHFAPRRGADLFGIVRRFLESAPASG